MVKAPGRPLPPGTIVGRWKVVRRAAPVSRPWWTGMVSRLQCRCVCGIEQAVLDRDLKLGRSKGCRSKTCRAAWMLAEQVEDAVGIEAARDMARAMLEANVPTYHLIRKIREMDLSEKRRATVRLPSPRQLELPEVW